MQMGFDKDGINKKIKELFIEKKQTCVTLASSIGSNIGDHQVNKDFDFDTYQEMKKYKINGIEERTIFSKLIRRLKCISD